MSKECDSVIEDILAEARHDYVGLWEICLKVKVRKNFNPDESSLKAFVLTVVGRLLACGLQAVDLASSGPGCTPWPNQDPQHVLDRISIAWDALGREPSVNEIAWFNDPASQ